jgi:hypothetical protein
MADAVSDEERERLFKKADSVRNLFQPDIGRRINTPIIGGKAVNPVTGNVYDLAAKKQLGNYKDLGI